MIGRVIGRVLVSWFATAAAVVLLCLLVPWVPNAALMFTALALFAIVLGLPFAMWAVATDGYPDSPRARRIVGGLLIACVLSVALAAQDVPLPDTCTEEVLRAICGEWWYWCGVVMGCPL